jgi:hypothetical protein
MVDFYAIKGKVVEICKATLPDFTTTWSFTTRNPPRTWCYIGKLMWPEGEWVTNRSTQYGVTVPIVLNAIRAKSTPEDSEAWLAERMNALMGAFQADSDLRSIGVITWTAVPRYFDSQPHPDGIEVQAVIELQVTYRP